MNTYDHRSYVACQILPNPKPKRKIPQTSVFVLVEMLSIVNPIESANCSLHRYPNNGQKKKKYQTSVGMHRMSAFIAKIRRISDNKKMVLFCKQRQQSHLNNETIQYNDSIRTAGRQRAIRHGETAVKANGNKKHSDTYTTHTHMIDTHIVGRRRETSFHMPCQFASNVCY